MIPLFVQKVYLRTELCELLWKENYDKGINSEPRIYKLIREEEKKKKRKLI